MVISNLFYNGNDESEHHGWISRDYEDIDCEAVGCFYNREKKCAVPTRCKMGEDGRCKGFQAKETPKKIDGD